MKRQRTNSDNDDDTGSIVPGASAFDTVLESLQQEPKLSVEQLTILAQEIDAQLKSQRALQVNLLTQNFPPELWLQISEQVIQDDAQVFPLLKFWLACRTVSKSWFAWVPKVDCSRQPFLLFGLGSLNLTRFLTVLYFSQISIDSEKARINDLSLLSRVKSLALSHPESIPPNQLPLLSRLTQLTGLRCTNKHMLIPQESLLCLTNLRWLALSHNPHVTTLHTLTNLTSLDLFRDFSLQQSQILSELPRLTSLHSNHPEFFRCGRGKCMVLGKRTWRYAGEWLNGKYHGQGRYVCFGPKEPHTMEGGWINGKPHGHCVWRLEGRDGKDFDAYVGEYVDGKKEGRGVRTYKNGDKYEGYWTNGKRSGSGVYVDDRGLYDGDWRNGHPHGFGRYKFAEEVDLLNTVEGFWDNGVISRGRLKIGERSEDGIWTWEGDADSPEQDVTGMEVPRTVDTDTEESSDSE